MFGATGRLGDPCDKTRVAKPTRGTVERLHAIARTGVPLGPHFQPPVRYSQSAVTIAYLINQYPQPSQSFIRREIAALDEHGLTIARFTLRKMEGPLVDEADKSEQRRTRAVLGVGALGLIGAMTKVLFTRPLAWLRTLRLAWRIGKRSDRGRLLHLVYFAEACVLLGWLRAAKARHLHAHFGTNSTTVAMLCHALGGPTYSFTAHGPEEFDKPQSLALGEKIRRAAFVIAISEYGRSQLFRWCGHEDWPKIHIVHCGVDAAFLEAGQSPIPASPRLVCIGRLCEQKGQLLLVRAVARLVAEGTPVEIVLVGDGPLRAPIEKLIAEHKLEDHVRITGWASNQLVREELLAARAMVLPSFAEGLPVVIMEALALGRPVVSTYVAGIPELVEPGVSGWLVPPGSTDALVTAMRAALAATPAQLEAMGRAGTQRVAAQHNIRTESRKLADLFE